MISHFNYCRLIPCILDFLLIKEDERGFANYIENYLLLNFGSKTVERI
jgi:hypothetical protein